MDRTILHMDLDTFFVSCERLIDSRLEGKPLLVGGTGSRGVVSACSYETRGFGIHSGMPMKMARNLCPEAIVIKGNAGTYTKYSRMVTEIIQEDVPVLEKASVDEFYADLSGMDKYFGSYQFATELRQKIIRETGLPISFGMSINKTVSKVATGEAKPNNQMKIDQGLEKYFLAPLSVRKIPMVGAKTYQSMCHLGLKRIKTVQDMPVEMMESAFGRNGKVIWLKANGLDDSPVIQYHERKSISNERTFGRDTIDVRMLESTITAMAEQLAYQLRQGQRLTSCVSVKLRYADFSTHTKQRRIPYSSADHTLISIVKELFASLYQRRLLVRLIGVNFSGLVQGNHQMHLFEDSEEMMNLYQAMDKVRNRYGSRCITRASTIGGNRSVGGNYNPFNGEPPMVLAHRTL